MPIRRLAIAAAVTLTACLTLLVSGAWAQRYPAKTIRIVVPFAPGGNVDLIARVVAPKMGEALGQQVVVDNRGGAGSIIGTELIARAAPDGYNLLLAASAHVMNPALVKKLPYDSISDFTPIALIAEVPTALVVHPSLPVKNVRDLVVLAKTRPGELNYSTAGRGTNGHLAGEWLNSIAKIRIEHVPYKGAAPAMLDLLAGNVQLQFTSMPAVIEYVRSGRLRMLALAANRRSPAVPDVPTMEESGLPGFVVTTGYGLLAPAGIPRPLVEQINDAVKKALMKPGVKSQLSGQGADPVGSTPDEHDSFNKAEIQKWARLVKSVGIQPE
ncbi:MAG: tripartite tricarboxylate transporter substrate binding protein [Betaproteobacteria bacterium]|nr:tripartite tricarboxylate transporter substrate binding protein [Betaproteobacteria bacterium]